MIPLRDDVPSRTTPIVNWALIVTNVLFFAYELSMGERIEQFFAEAAVIPSLVTGADRVLTAGDLVRSTIDPSLGLRMLTSMFLHGGWLHLIGNMLYLWIFGDNVEDRFGHVGYVIFYLLCGLIATYAHILASPRSPVPSIGASGAIAGVLGAYITLYPHARVVGILPLGFFTQMVKLPAVFFLGLWFLQQFLSGTMGLANRESGTGGVAWWAHIGGFVAGAALVWVFQKPRRAPHSKDTWWRSFVDSRRTLR
jgi:membrane associated rhomboid family serine protease